MSDDEFHPMMADGYETEQFNASVGYIYCLSNPAMPGLVKIGYTNRSTARRVSELSYGTDGSSATGVPLPFEIVKDWRVPAEKSFEIEQAIHRRLHEHRIEAHGKRQAKEFFRLTTFEAREKIEAALKIFDWWHVTQAKARNFEDQVKARAKRQQIEYRLRRIHEEWLRIVHLSQDQRVNAHHAATDARLQSAGHANGLKWGAIWFGGMALVFFGIFKAKDGAFWLCALAGVIVYYMNTDGPVIEYKNSSKFRAEIESIKARSIAESVSSIKVDCPNKDCDKSLRFGVKLPAAEVDIRCPSCATEFSWAIPKVDS